MPNLRVDDLKKGTDQMQISEALLEQECGLGALSISNAFVSRTFSEVDHSDVYTLCLNFAVDPRITAMQIKGIDSPGQDSQKLFNNMQIFYVIRTAYLMTP